MLDELNVRMRSLLCGKFVCFGGFLGALVDEPVAQWVGEQQKVDRAKEDH